MRLTPMLISRTGFVFLVLSAVWSNDLASPRLGLNGVTFMVAGLFILVIAGIMCSTYAAVALETP